ncbi:MAG: threonine ammonia-lyase [Deltaproteobacteria bacterium]|nr:threonine ammonia-lyase [Deltaproteobacteria bacterium]
MLQRKEIQAVEERLKDYHFVTPLERSSELDCRGVVLYSKLETLQRTGSFKIRGALNKILSLSGEERKRGVVAASMGNHAQGVALAAKLVGIPALIVMPNGAPLVKLENTRSYGAEVLERGESFEESLDCALSLSKERGLTFIPAFDDETIIAGQGVVGLEILRQLPSVDEVVVPVGGGGLISGVSMVLKESNPKIKITGVQASGANAAVLSFQKKSLVHLDHSTTFADGIRVNQPGKLCLEYIQKYVDRMVQVDDDEIAQAVLSLMDRSKAVVEGAAATTLAAVQKGVAGEKGKNTVLLLSGGNIDFTQIARILNRGLAQTGRIARIVVLIPDVPGQLAALLNIIKEEGANVLEVEHDRAFYSGPINCTQVKVTLETKGKRHIGSILARIEGAGYKPEAM